ncbi:MULTISPECIES: hypothetical protein [unclassified Mesorhizobium]|uniref:hypothetical protein n=1 Tax=unclassified Mesorhizobium TaxID=325217 RepID=UPI000FD740DF|nr:MULTISPECIES: hypothetical protein [unclassified Mesorhizobium]TGQ43995.1 hypothetical protein EN859_009605 [Mesorhizobium sp. M00.F.Ca.ET.216.01.1.1]TIS59139.1 MAG: hypothetical protein E5W91_06645 [Mesorhizobium sp.]TIS90829.1 MAG: hypothetical protein E5W89_10640 [Mesorhizobium sp.]TJW16024.1 MAG: hypothetical protein E5W82_06750 [Mesorhizobium sp.]TJW48536.1 MAG: hypothetical protein E5W83_02710 [Mesorhizobium sp.]
MNAPKLLEGEDGKAGGAAGFFRSRWQGMVPLDRLFWRDLVVVGSAINLASSVAALILLGLKLSLALVLAVHFAPVPYNIFLTFAVWRTTEKTGGAKAWMMTLGATLWLILVVVV